MIGQKRRVILVDTDARVVGSHSTVTLTDVPQGMGQCETPSIMIEDFLLNPAYQTDAARTKVLKDNIEVARASGVRALIVQLDSATDEGQALSHLCRVLDFDLMSEDTENGRLTFSIDV